MDSLQSIKTQLISQINELPLEQNAISVCSAQTECTVNLLSWLKAQPHYPQYYFKCQQSEQAFAALGEVRVFDQLSAAQHFVEQFDLSLFGGMKFNGDTYFFLPRLLLEQTQHRLTVKVFIDHANLTESKRLALDTLKTLEKMTALSTVQSQPTLAHQQADQPRWQHWVEQALAQIRSGYVGKLVLANETTFRLSAPLNAQDFLAQSEAHNHGCYHFLLAQHPNSVFLGSTPERLYARHERNLTTEALAGTALMTDDPQQNQQQAQWLLQDAKNIHENQLVAEGICANLSAFAKQIQLSEVGLKQLRRVQHLRREITALLTENCTDLDCLKAIHPTAAVAGLPQQSARTLLAQIENYDRSWYAGTLGFFNQARAEFCVTIRSAFIEADKIRVFAGAGIVEGSVPLLEWQEIERKATGLISLLQITESKNGEKKCQ
ncbi:isochorismate synthase [Aggregatibacter kilianii]|uniref:isochorismate synthase n=1 Tax=Aggregatibacter kilianii TaxID=2025884 RepID=UPI000D65B561|nr:isochorismate synthase [Aggregatibacter kilianii]